MLCNTCYCTLVLVGTFLSPQSFAQIDNSHFSNTYFHGSQIHVLEDSASGSRKDIPPHSVALSISVNPVNEGQILTYAASITKISNDLTIKVITKRQALYARMIKIQCRINSKLKNSNYAGFDISNQINIYANVLSISNKSIAHYLPSIDSLQTSLRFLNGLQLVSQNIELIKRIQEAANSLKGFEQELNIANGTKLMIDDRLEQLSQKLTSMGGVNFANKFKELKKLRRSLVVYTQQVQQFKDNFKNQSTAISKAINLLSKTKLYQDFMTKNSVLAGIFGYPGQGIDTVLNASGLGGLQTHGQVDRLVRAKMESSGNQAMAQVQQNMQQAKAAVNSLKDKVTNYGQGSYDLDTRFEPNSQQSKTFLQRIEYTTNIQTQRSNYFFPVTTDIGLGVGYKLSDSKTIGLGLSYKVGLGSDFRHIAISHQGVGFRTFIDWKFKNSFYVSGGFEMNYKTSITSFYQLSEISAWQQSGLIGMVKKVNIHSKLIKNSKLQFYWDFMSYYQLPRTQPIIFRIGYTL